MDFTNILEILPTLTDCQMKVVYDHMAEIQRRREAEKKEALINNFKEAFYALKEADVDIKYENWGLDLEVSLDKFDCFGFY